MNLLYRKPRILDRLFAGLTMLALAVSLVPNPVFAQGPPEQQVNGNNGGQPEKVTICHATNSHENPYNQQEPNESADVSGHDGHNGPVWYPGIEGEWGDIIPPFDYDGGSYSGKNWTEEGQTIHRNDCEVPKELVIPVEPLTLTSMCTYPDNGGAQWRVRNDKNKFDVDFTWEIYNNQETGGPITATHGPAFGAGDTFFDSTLTGTMKIYWENEDGKTQSATKATNPKLCEPEPEPTVTISATKIICPDESLLPDDGYKQIDADTATEFLAQNPTCELAKDWDFQWALGGVSSENAPDNDGALDSNGWQTPVSTVGGVATMEISESQLGKETTISVREVMEPGYVPFSGTGGSDVSAEIYCANDAAHYDNLEWIKKVKLDSTYHCVAWNVPTKEPVATVVAEKIVCETEEYLPNYNDDGEAPMITDTTASQYVADSEGKCWLEDDWYFEWAPQSTTNPDNDLPANPLYGAVGGVWTQFGPTDGSGKAQVTLSTEDIGNDSAIWVREVLQDNYIPFTYGPGNQTNADNVTAELYCHKDGKNYDNYDRVDGIAVDETYHCVAWNVLADKTTSYQCDAGLLFLDTETQAPEVSTLYTVDETDGSATFFADYDLELFPVLAVADDETVYTIDKNTGELITLDDDSGAYTVVGATGITGEKPVAMEFAPDGTLYALTENTDALYEINPANGVATKLHDLDLDVAGGDVVFDSAMIVYVRNQGQVYGIDSGTYDETLLGTLSVGSQRVTSAASKNGTHYAYTREDGFYPFTLDPFVEDTAMLQTGPFAWGDGSFCPADIEEPEYCTVEIVSDTTNTVTEKDGAYAKLVSFIHSAWTAVIPDADWIWGDDPIVAPVAEDTQTFVKSFGWNGPVVSATLEIASDNSHEYDLNGTTGGDPSENNHAVGTQDSYDVTGAVVQGTNTLEVAVKNWAGNTDPKKNPAGLLYKLTVVGTDKDCGQPPEEPEYPIDGYKWNDADGDGNWDEGEAGIPEWGIVVRPMSLKPLETLSVDSSQEDNAVSTTNTLDSGRIYLIEVSGTYDFGPGIADAEWADRSDAYADNPLPAHGWTKGEYTYPSVYGLDLLMNGQNVEWGSFNDDHLYKTIVFGDDATHAFSIYDSYYGDNDGVIDVAIYDVTDYVVYTDSEGYYEVYVPEGEYQIVEMMKRGWEQTYPKNPSYYHVTVPNGTEPHNFGNRNDYDPEKELIIMCKRDPAGAPVPGWGMTLSNGETTYELETEGDGCVTQSVDPDQGPWTVTEEDRPGWTLTHVSSSNGTLYYEEDGQYPDGCRFFGEVPSVAIFRTIEVEAPEFVCTFTNEQDEQEITTTSTGGGGSLLGGDPEGDTRGSSDTRESKPTITTTSLELPEGEVQGEQVSVVPAGAPNAGGGGTSSGTLPTVPFLAFLGILVSVALFRGTVVNV